MPRCELSRLEYCDIRDIFESEPQDFSVWLEQHLDLLGDALGIELTVIEREASVGDFFADIVVREVGRDRTLLIECQLTPTDHDHLGKPLVYAAGLGARGVIWVAAGFRDEHRRVFEWLNEQTAEELNFFAVEFSVVRIDNSRPAPMFKPLVVPNEWARAARRSRSSGLGRAYAHFWETMLDPLRRAGLTSARRTSDSNWFTLSAGISEGSIELAFTRNGCRIAYELRTDPPGIAWRAMRILRQTMAEAGDVAEGEWEAEGRRKYPRISRRFPEPVSITECSDEKRHEPIAWTIETVRDFRSRFPPAAVKDALERARSTAGGQDVDGDSIASQ